MEDQNLKNTLMYAKMTAKGTDVLDKRSALVLEEMYYDQKRRIDEKKQAIRKIEMNISQLEDFGPETSESLRPVPADFDPAEWNREMNDLWHDKTIKEEELAIMEDVFNHYYGKVVTDAKKEETDTAQ